MNWQTDLPALDVPVRIARRLAPRGRATQVWPERRNLAITTEGAWLRFRIPRVGPHVMVTLE